MVVLGSGCGSVGRVVTSYTRGHSSNPVIGKSLFYIEHLFTVNCVLKRQKKRPGMAFLKKRVWWFFIK